ncbi:MAG: nucleotide sugar dehydrogenase [Candidatus Micrarchaeota archaeon]
MDDFNLKSKISSKKAVVCIVGVGYIGLPNAVLFASKGYTVIAADVNERIVRMTNEGKSHIKDAVLEKSVPQAFATGRLKATQDVSKAVSESDAVLISVPTPSENGEPDLSFVENSCAAIGKSMKKGTLVVLESTVYPGCCEEIVKPILERESGLQCGRDFFLAHCPERMNPGDTTHTVGNTIRIVGGVDSESGEIAKALYESVLGPNVLLVKNMKTAELVKLVENTQRDVNIAFINEIALLCEKLGVDARELVDACATKWNFYKLYPGPGVGGHCLPNNPYYILKAAGKVGFKPRLFPLAREINDSMPAHVVELVEKALAKTSKKISGTKIAVLGVAYKPNLDDVRQAPSRTVIPLLLQKNADLVVSDPHVNEANLKKVFEKHSSLEKAIEWADCLVFLCAHDEYKKLGESELKEKIVVDGALVFEKPVGRIYERVGL